MSRSASPKRIHRIYPDQDTVGGVRMHVAPSCTGHQREDVESATGKGVGFGIRAWGLQHKCEQPLPAPREKFLETVAERSVWVSGGHEFDIAPALRNTHCHFRPSTCDTALTQDDDRHPQHVSESSQALREVVDGNGDAWHSCDHACPPCCKRTLGCTVGAPARCASGGDV